MLRSTEMADSYQGGAYIHRWVLVDGCPRCIDNALAAGDPGAAAQIAANAALRARLAPAEAYEDATLLSGRPEPVPAARPVYDAQGNRAGSAETPEHAAWVAAKALVAGAVPGTLDLAAVRQGAPSAIDPASGLANPDYAAWCALRDAVDAAA